MLSDLKSYDPYVYVDNQEGDQQEFRLRGVNAPASNTGGLIAWSTRSTLTWSWSMHGQPGSLESDPGIE